MRKRVGEAKTARTGGFRAPSKRKTPVPVNTDTGAMVIGPIFGPLVVHLGKLGRSRRVEIER